MKKISLKLVTWKSVIITKLVSLCLLSEDYYITPSAFKLSCFGIEYFDPNNNNNNNNNVKWYMKCFIYWTVDLKSGKPWSSQLWTQFKQLRREAWKSQDFNGVWTVTSRYQCDALTNWAMKPLTWSRVQTSLSLWSTGILRPFPSPLLSRAPIQSPSISWPVNHTETYRISWKKALLEHDQPMPGLCSSHLLHNCCLHYRYPHASHKLTACRWQLTHPQNTHGILEQASLIV